MYQRYYCSLSTNLARHSHPPPPGIPYGFVPHANDGRNRARNGVDPKGHMNACPQAHHHFTAHFGAPNMDLISQDLQLN
ncbi:hypothetical protein B9Z55_023373 [Caenorhabditis nigoni]|uniref:Uncharacterized protein n=1 Tax=Caenorhabditis nigoni TaxID=1611254 RepID=A0A2G5SPV8_9PELO|nr:hypothetical protein B9Z55_023373 [Caenorhabditis nigoni]